jgi:tetratricopeptide (TPR) repeat protein
MQLVLFFAPPWTVKHAPDQRQIAIGPELVVTYGPLTITTGDSPLHVDVPAGARVRPTRSTQHSTRDGWPLILVDAELVTTDGAIETRLYACYTFFAYTAVAIARAATSSPIDARRDDLVAAFERGRPDWREAPMCLADAWDVGALEQQLELPATLPYDHLRRGRVLIGLGRASEAVVALRAALELAPELAAAHYELGVALGELGDHAGAASQWQRALAVAPELIDARYNLAQSQYLLGDYEAALAGFDAVARREPSELAVERKRIQCLYALGRVDEGQAARSAFRRAWDRSRDPRETRLAEYVFDQFRVAGFYVHAIETLRPRDPACFPVLAFRAMRGPSHDQPVSAEVLVETSELARAAGTPFVIAVVANSTYRVIGGHANLPSYLQLKAEIVPLLVAALGG